MLFHAALVAALVALPCSWAKVFEKCELARELLYVHGFPEDQIPQCEPTPLVTVSLLCTCLKVAAELTRDDR